MHSVVLFWLKNRAVTSRPLHDVIRSTWVALFVAGSEVKMAASDALLTESALGWSIFAIVLLVRYDLNRVPSTLDIFLLKPKGLS